jgi:hypothetical protein
MDSQIVNKTKSRDMHSSEKMLPTQSDTMRFTFMHLMLGCAQCLLLVTRVSVYVFVCGHGDQQRYDAFNFSILYPVTLFKPPMIVPQETAADSDAFLERLDQLTFRHHIQWCGLMVTIPKPELSHRIVFLSKILVLRGMVGR